MGHTFSDKIKHELEAFFTSPIFPFLRKDWYQVWIFIPLSYIPLINLIISRGWRLELVHRMGWGNDAILPPPNEAFKYFKNGLLLWIITFLYTLIPIIIISQTGLGGLRDAWNDTLEVFNIIFAYFWEGTMSTSQFIDTLWNFTVNEFFASIWVVVIENVYLIIYIPMYRVAMIRFALTKNLLASHFALIKNLKFLFRNIIEIVLMYLFKYFFNNTIILMVDLALSLTVIGTPLIPIVTFGIYYWGSGYHYGILAELMVEQENMKKTNDKKEPELIKTHS